MRESVTPVWKTFAVILAVIVGIFASNTAGWNLGASLFGPADYSEGFGGFLNTIMGGIGLTASVAVLYFVFRIAKWVLWGLVPVMLYFAFVVGLWNGLGSDFDTTRLAAIRYHYANAYALQHMSATAFALSCADARITLTEDAKALCRSPTKK